MVSDELVSSDTTPNVVFVAEVEQVVAVPDNVAYAAVVAVPVPVAYAAVVAVPDTAAYPPFADLLSLNLVSLQVTS